jgi:hypothetical protein
MNSGCVEHGVKGKGVAGRRYNDVCGFGVCGEWDAEVWGEFSGVSGDDSGSDGRKRKERKVSNIKSEIFVEMLA